MLDQLSHATASSNELSASNIFMVASGKGGVGKTWFSISLGYALAQAGKNVLIFDGDLGLANVDIQLGLMPKMDLGSFVAGKCTLQEAITSYPAEDGELRGRLDILPGRSGSGGLSRLSVQRLGLVRQGLRTLAPQYDVLLIDLGAGIGGTVRSLAPLASQCFIITMDEPTALTDAYAFMKVMRNTESSKLGLHIVINQADSEKSGNHTYESLSAVCQNFLQFKPNLLGIIREDVRVPDAIRHQRPLSVRHPNTMAVQDLERIVKKIEALLV